MKLALKRKAAEAGGAEDAPKAPVKRKKPKKKTLILLSIILVAAVGIGILIWKLFFTGSKAVVLTDITTYGSLAQTITGTAITIPADSYTYTAASDSEIEEVDVSPGDTVKKGDLLYIQDDSEVDDDIDGYQSDIEDNEDNLTDYREQLSDLQEELADLTVSAPFSGRLLDVQVDQGDTVKSGDTLCTIVDDSTMKLTQYFSYAYEDQISQGMSAVLSIPDLMLTLNGTVTDIRKVDRVTSEGTRCFAVTVTVKNPGALTQDMEAGGYLVTADGESIYPAVEGSLEYNQEQTLTAGGSGDLLTVNAEDYQGVSSDETLFVVDDSDYQTKIRDLNTQIQRAQDKITALQEKITEAEASKSKYEVHSDIDGKVIMVMIQAGDTPTQGRTTVAVYDLTSMTVDASVDELDISYLSDDMPVRIVRSGAEKDEEYEGTITDVGLEATSTNGVATFTVEIKIDSNGDLSPGVNVSYYIDVGDDTEEGALAPVAAVQYTDEGTCLFVQSDTRPDNAIDLAEGVVPEGFYAVPVEVGTSSGALIRILSGAEKDMTVFTGYQKSAPSGGDSTSEGDGTTQTTDNSQMGPNGNFSGGPGNFSGGPGGGMNSR